MATFTLHNTPFPDGTAVGAYNATGYSNFPSGGPPGTAEVTATAAEFSVAFEGLIRSRSYFAAAKVAGIWRNISFIVDGSNADEGVASLLAESGVGVIDCGEDPTVERGTDFASYIWICDLEPENMIEDDQWVTKPVS